MQHDVLHWVTAGLRRTWLVAVAAVIACAAFAARGISSLVEAQYLDPSPPRVTLHAVQAPAAKAKPDGSELVARNMFCSTCTEIGGPGPTASYEPDAILIATSVGADPRATLRVPATEVQGSWGLGDVVPGVGRIVRIGFSSIEVADGERRATLSLFDSIPGGRSDAGAATPAPAAADPFADRIRKLDDRTYEVERELVRDLVRGAVKPGSVRVAPVTKDGKLTGLRLFGVRAGSPASAMGLRTGDVLQAVNGKTVDSANTLLELYAQLDQLASVELDGTRAGKPLTLMLRLR
jgi:hypothetical protein